MLTGNGASMPPKKQYSPILLDFTPYDPFKAKPDPKAPDLRTHILAVSVVIAVTALFLAMIYCMPLGL
jgi:hypothetical protein